MASFDDSGTATARSRRPNDGARSSLGRRGPNSDGPYRLVRHPTYAGYPIAYLGYVAENPSLGNIVLLVVGTAFSWCGSARRSAFSRPIPRTRATTAACGTA
jgi:Phospholipid methyltransferase